MEPRLGIGAARVFSNSTWTTSAAPPARWRDHVRNRRASFVVLADRLVDPASGHDHAACDGYLYMGKSEELLFSEAKLQEVCGGKAGALGLKRWLQGRGVASARRRAAVHAADNLGERSEPARAGRRGAGGGV
jgi:hypothetical protein